MKRLSGAGQEGLYVLGEGNVLDLFEEMVSTENKLKCPGTHLTTTE